MSRRKRDTYPNCPWCGQVNWTYGTIVGPRGESGWCWYWDGPRQALWAGWRSNLWVGKKGRIYGGTGWGHDKPKPVRVNAKRWKVVRSGPRLLVACANPFHEDETK